MNADPLREALEQYANSLGAAGAALIKADILSILAAHPAPSEENERLTFERLSRALTGGNAATWDEVIHAAENSNYARGWNDAITARAALSAPQGEALRDVAGEVWDILRPWLKGDYVRAYDALRDKFPAPPRQSAIGEDEYRCAECKDTGVVPVMSEEVPGLQIGESACICGQYAEAYAKEAVKRERGEILADLTGYLDFLTSSADPPTYNLGFNHGLNCAIERIRSRGAVPAPKLEKLNRDSLFAPDDNELRITDRLNEIIDYLQRKERA